MKGITAGLLLVLQISVFAESEWPEGWDKFHQGLVQYRSKRSHHLPLGSIELGVGQKLKLTSVPTWVSEVVYYVDGDFSHRERGMRELPQYLEKSNCAVYMRGQVGFEWQRGSNLMYLEPAKSESGRISLVETNVTSSIQFFPNEWVVDTMDYIAFRGMGELSSPSPSLELNELVGGVVERGRCRAECEPFLQWTVYRNGELWRDLPAAERLHLRLETDQSVRYQVMIFAIKDDTRLLVSSVLHARFSGKPDSDGDGIPDEWEIKNQLDPQDSTDAFKEYKRTGSRWLDFYRRF